MISEKVPSSVGSFVSSRSLTWILFIVVAVVMVAPLGDYGLLEPDEGRYGEIGREMSLPDGDWLIPHLNGVPHFQKPPLFYWLTAVSLKIFPIGEFAARLPVALCALGTLLFSIGISRRLFGSESAGRYAFLILASSPLFLILSRTITPDSTMTFWITGAVYFLVRAREDSRWGWLMFVFAGLGFLTKGPVAFLVPFCAAIGYSISVKKVTGKRLKLPWLPGVLIAVLIGLSWFIVVSVNVPDLAEYFWKYELVERFGSSTHGRSRPFWFFLPIIFVGFLPWTFEALHALPGSLRERTESTGLFVGWILVPFVILSLSGSKLPTYLLPLFPGMAVAVAGFFASASSPDGLAVKFPRWVRISGVVGLVLLSFGPLLPGLLIAGAGLEKPVLVILFAVPVSIAGVIWLFRNWTGAKEGAVYIFSFLAIAGWVNLFSHLGEWNGFFQQQASVKPLVETIRAESSGSKIEPRVIACEVRAHGLEFYLERLVEITKSSADVAMPSDSETFVGNRTVFHPGAKFVAELKPSDDGEPVFVIARTKVYEKLFAPRGWEKVQTCGDFILLRR